MRILNLYAGIGGNRKLWARSEVVAVELDPTIAGIYQEFYPNDTVIVGDAHKYLLENYEEFDFIWSSPPLSYPLTTGKIKSSFRFQNHWCIFIKSKISRYEVVRGDSIA